MKLIYFFIFFILTNQLIFSQENEDGYCIDVDSFNSFIYDDSPEFLSAIDNRMDNNCFDSLLNHIQNKLLDTTLWKRENGYKLSLLIAEKTNDDVLKQKAIKTAIELSRYSSFSLEYLYKNPKFNREDFDKESKKIISNQLNKKYSQEEYNLFISNQIASWKSSKEYVNLINKDYHDSLYKVKENEVLEKAKLKFFNNYLKVDKWVILAVGWLELKECIPQLKILADGENKENALVAQYALARMHVQPYHDELVYKYKVFDHPDLDVYLFYICTQEALFKFSELCDSDKKGWSGTYDNKVYWPVKYLPMILLSRNKIILNFPLSEPGKKDPVEVVLKEASPEYLKQIPEWMSITEKWLKGNKGKYELNREVFYWGNVY